MCTADDGLAGELVGGLVARASRNHTLLDQQTVTIQLPIGLEEPDTGGGPERAPASLRHFQTLVFGSASGSAAETNRTR